MLIFVGVIVLWSYVNTRKFGGNMDTGFCMVLTTTNCASNKEKIISNVLTEKLAACVQTMSIQSHYVWEGKLCVDEEFLIIMKTTNGCYMELERCIVESHDYDVPQIVQVPFTQGFNPYLTWLEENTRR